MRVHGTPDILPEMIRSLRVLPNLREMSWPKHDDTEGIVTLAQDKRPETMLLIVLSYYALKHRTCTLIRVDA